MDLAIFCIFGWNRIKRMHKENAAVKNGRAVQGTNCVDTEHFSRAGLKKHDFGKQDSEDYVQCVLWC
jgi:hypothetical protein